MATTEEKSPLTVALINSETLESELISTSLTCSGSPKTPPLSVYAVAQLMNKRYRREFIYALNHHQSFECITLYEGHRVSISLCTTGVFGNGWSHLLVLGDTQSGARLA